MPLQAPQTPNSPLTIAPSNHDPPCYPEDDLGKQGCADNSPAPEPDLPKNTMPNASVARITSNPPRRSWILGPITPPSLRNANVLSTHIRIVAAKASLTAEDAKPPRHNTDPRGWKKMHSRALERTSTSRSSLSEDADSRPPGSDTDQPNAPSDRAVGEVAEQKTLQTLPNIAVRNALYSQQCCNPCRDANAGVDRQDHPQAR